MSVRSAQLGAAVVGLGVGEQHARALAADPRCRLRRVYDRDAAKARRLGGALGAEAANGFEDLLEDPEIQIIAIASFDQDHAAQAAAALAAGKHVFVEKPLARTRKELSALRKAWAKGGKPHVASNLVLRAAPLYRWLIEAVRAGELGQIYAFDGDYLYGRLEKITDGWRKEVKDYSVMQGGGIHLADLMLSVAGEAPETVFTAGSRVCTRGTAFKYDDFAAATFAFPSGLVGRITANFGCVHRHQHVVRVFGTKATFLYDDAGPRLHSSRSPDARPKTLKLAPEPASKGALIPDFVSAIASGADPEPGLARELSLAAACAAADESLSKSQPVAVEPL